MSFGRHGYPGRRDFEVKQRYDTVAHELGADWPTDEMRELFRAEPGILSYLDYAKAIAPALGLNRKHVLNSPSIDPNVKLVGLDLTHVRNSSTQVILQRIA